MKGRRELVIATAIVLAVSARAAAQAPAPTPAPPASVAPAQAPVAVAVPQEKPAAPAETTPKPPRAAFHDRAATQGFSVVLVLADLAAASGGQDDVPPAARRALTDMKDFLPYKSYKLLDAAWILGQGTGRSLTRLRGVDDQEYELRLETAPQDAKRVFVRFMLADTHGDDAAVEAAAIEQRDDTEREINRLRMAQEQARAARQEAEVKAIERRLADLQRQVERTRAAAKPVKIGPHRPVVDTNFTMDVGETVVVGTSRLRGGSRALIALLTAVPPRGGRAEVK
jgi:hypothetical protein